jgi:hypothetical protein
VCTVAAAILLFVLILVSVLLWKRKSARQVSASLKALGSESHCNVETAFDGNDTTSMDMPTISETDFGALRHYGLYDVVGFEETLAETQSNDELPITATRTASHDAFDGSLDWCGG